MFNALNPAELEIVLGAMVSVFKKAGEVIIREGDDGDNLYVVGSGQLICTKILVSYTQISFSKLPNIERELWANLP